MCNMERIGLTVSEEMSFENVDGRTDGRTPDACIYFGSGELTRSIAVKVLSKYLQ